jgi:hypothetical protein
MTDFGLEDFIIGLIEENEYKIKGGGLAAIIDQQSDGECNETHSLRFNESGMTDQSVDLDDPTIFDAVRRRFCV